MDSSASEFVNGLVVPKPLIQAIKNGEWKRPKSRVTLVSVFPERDVFRPTFYDLDEMRFENAIFTGDVPEWVFGRSNLARPPGDIDPKNAVIIANMGSDEAVALDYRRSRTNPSVLFFASGDPPAWILVSERIEDLLIRLGCNY